ncbi:MAG: prepilin-type N-terminal cleavage/methylation domain-containing protein [Aliiglaciecola sp.]|uniref:type IV pilus modification PilV family protein n=1 Tax=Aliiglaciecola sp. TaxID=1872441 RepID=UPI0032989C3A
MAQGNHKRLTVNYGFSLIEVMIASLLLLVGVTGFATMQTHIMTSKQSLDMHATAVQIAKQKMIELRYFEQNRKSEVIQNFQSIADDQGGISHSGEMEIVENTHTENTLKFKQHWQVREQYFVDSDEDGKADKWVTSESEIVPSPLPPLPARKEVKVQVSWIDEKGDSKKYELTSFIAPIPTHRSYHAFNKTEDSEVTPERQMPLAHYKAQMFHKIDKNTLQTSLPIQLHKQQPISRLDTFKLVYDEDSKLSTAQQQRELAFSQCRCKLSVKSNAKTPAQIIIDANQLNVQPGKWTTKMTGIPEPGQSPLCSSCCRDHHDSEAMLEEQNYYRKESDSPHTHYKLTDDGKYLKASNSGDQYDELCRFQRVNGEFEILADLQSLQTIAFLKNQMTTAFNSEYQKHVSDLLKNFILGKDLPVSPLEKTVTLVPSAAQLELRSLYIERLTEEHKVTLQQMILKDDSDWLKLTPFLDVELTMHADWNSGDKAVARITNQPRETSFSPKDQLYASYSKGRLVALATGNTKLTNSLNRGNEGLTGSPAISVFNLSQVTSSSPMQLKVKEGNLHGLVVDIYCVSSEADLEQPCSVTQMLELSKLKVTPEKEGFSCSTEIAAHPSTSFFNCSMVPNGWIGTIAVDSSLLEAKVSLFWKDPSGKLTLGNNLGITTPITATSHSEYWLIVEFNS